MEFIFLLNMFNNNQPEDFSKYKYVIYARKSTEESDRQLRSLDDQIKECRQLAVRSGLKVVDVIKESKSAKKPHKRAEFNALLKRLASGKVDGIIAWAPDRLARNMLEAGIVIDMIDDEKIKDLRFATYPFSKDANGLMLLGMSFVLSKQYSDKLSQDSSRGTYSKLAEGKTGIEKHGYDKNDAGYFVPSAMFELLQNAWLKRMQGDSIVKIVKWLNDNDYAKTYKNKTKRVKITKQMLSRIFNDSFYYGKLKVNQTEVNLLTIPETNFQPMVTEQEFFQIQKAVNSGHKNRLRQPSILGVMPLSGIVRCAECGNACTVYPSKGKGGRYLYYTCRKPTCSENGKTNRGKVVFDWLYDFLKDGFNVTKKDYENMRASRKKKLGGIKSSLDADIRQTEMKIEKQSRMIDDISLKLANIENQVARKSLGEQLDKLQEEKEMTEAILEKQKAHKRELTTTDITWENFVNTTKNIGNILENGDYLQKDALVRNIFVNILVNNKKVVNYTLKEPFLALLNRNTDAVVLTGRGAGIRTLSK